MDSTSYILSHHQGGLRKEPSSRSRRPRVLHGHPEARRRLRRLRPRTRFSSCSAATSSLRCQHRSYTSSSKVRRYWSRWISVERIVVGSVSAAAAAERRILVELESTAAATATTLLVPASSSEGPSGHQASSSTSVSGSLPEREPSQLSLVFHELELTSLPPSPPSLRALPPRRGQQTLTRLPLLPHLLPTTPTTTTLPLPPRTTTSRSSLFRWPRSSLLQHQWKSPRSLSAASAR